jgi:hypothetical protein
VIPLWLKLVDTAYVAVLVPVYWRFYGPANFLWFSDLALLISLAALWLESPLLASMQALSVGLLELVWIADFLARLVSGSHLVGLTQYMFRPDLPRFVRALSLFHVWLPPLLFWMVWRLGYDSRALPAQTILAWVVLLGCYLWTDPADNINWVFGLRGERQRRLPSAVYLILLMAFLPIAIYLPTHYLLLAVVSPPGAGP